jgi:hypothetical protein
MTTELNENFIMQQEKERETRVITRLNFTCGLTDGKMIPSENSSSFPKEEDFN